jgi:LytS/YehU family sensor histidine kinase
LNTIAAVCSSEKALKSRQLITRLADFFRHALETEDPVLPLGKELEFVDAYLELESARFGEDLKIVRHLVLSEKALAAKVPILVIQPLVENAIRHGLRKRTGVGILTLEAFEEKDKAVIRISDDGAGAAPDFFENYLRHGKGQAEGHGIGVRNIDERLRRFFGKGDWVQFKTVLGQGTCAEVRIPLKGDLKV